MSSHVRIVLESRQPRLYRTNGISEEFMIRPLAVRSMCSDDCENVLNAADSPNVVVPELCGTLRGTFLPISQYLPSPIAEQRIFKLPRGKQWWKMATVTAASNSFCNPELAR